LLELDLVLNKFYEDDYQNLNEAEKKILLNILKKQDNDLWKILSKNNLIELIKEEIPS
jgi:succinate dehydrogenase flavin-adding protein (antitoxin of CptAB toxin-antitoxin module)